MGRVKQGKGGVLPPARVILLKESEAIALVEGQLALFRGLVIVQGDHLLRTYVQGMRVRETIRKAKGKRRDKGNCEGKGKGNSNSKEKAKGQESAREGAPSALVAAGMGSSFFGSSFLTGEEAVIETVVEEVESPAPEVGVGFEVGVGASSLGLVLGADVVKLTWADAPLPSPPLGDRGSFEKILILESKIRRGETGRGGK